MSERLQATVLLLLLWICNPASAAVSVTTLAQGFNGSGDVAVTADGNIFVGNFGDLLSNSNGTQVIKVTPDGQVSTFATGFQGASGNSIGPDGNLYQSSLSAGAVMRVDSQGAVTTFASGFSGGVIGNNFDSQGNLFVNTCGNNRVSRVDTAGNTTIFASGFPLNCPNGITVDDDDNVYVVNFGNGAVIKITPNGQMSVIATTPTSIFRPSGGNGHVVFANGVLYLVSNATQQVFEVTLDGQMTVIAGSGQRGHADGDPLSASFSSPNGIDVSPDGRLLYINESESTAGTVLNSNTFPLTPNRLRVVELFEAGPELLDINAGMTGAWFNPDTAGQGILIEPIPSVTTLFAAWFTFDEAGNKIGAPEHRWFTLQGGYQGGQADLQIFLNSGGVFDSPEPVSTDPVGTATLQFFDCTTAEFTYAFDSGPSGTIPLSRLTPDTVCTVVSGSTP
jgi:sugar lactone lactonase YvrE